MVCPSAIGVPWSMSTTLYLVSLVLNIEKIGVSGRDLNIFHSCFPWQPFPRDGIKI
jgi:hypothetical protein